MKSINPYLNFNGNAEEAFLFYKSVFGGEFTSIMRFKDTPGSEKLPAADRNKVAHIALPLEEGGVLAGSDTIESMGQAVKVGTNSYLFIEAESKEEADRLFSRLSTGGKVEMSMQDTFWGAYYGSFADRYGVQWMINFTYEQAE